MIKAADAFHTITMNRGEGCQSIHGYLIRDGQWAKVAGYVLGSLVFCLIGVWLGHVTALSVNGR